MQISGDNNCSEYQGAAGLYTCWKLSSCTEMLCEMTELICWTHPSLKQLVFDRHATIRENKLYRHFLPGWLRIYRPSGGVPSVSLREGGGDVIGEEIKKPKYNLTEWVNQEEPSEVSSFTKSCKMQDWTQDHDSGESNRKKRSRGVTEERNKGRRAVRQITGEREVEDIPGNLGNHSHTSTHTHTA